MGANYWVRFFLLFSIFSAVAGFSLPAASREITADDFRNSRFRGFIVADVKYGVRSSKDLDELAKTGANLARIFVGLTRCLSCNEYELRQSDIDTLDTLIQRLAERSIYSLPVLVPMGDERGPFWDSVSLQESYIEHWKKLALRFRGVRNIAGFDIMNEPVPPGRTYGDRQAVWLAYALTLSKEIRRVDPDRVLIVESAPDATPTSFENLKRLSIENVVYSFHSYYPMALTHQSVMKNYPDKMTYGLDGAMDASREELHKYLEVVAAFASKYDVPILVGEFGCVRWAPRGSSARYISDSVEYFEARGWSWLYNDFRAWTGWDSEIDSESKLETKRSMDAPVMRVLRSRMSKNMLN